MILEECFFMCEGVEVRVKGKLCDCKLWAAVGVRHIDGAGRETSVRQTVSHFEWWSRINAFVYKCHFPRRGPYDIHMGWGLLEPLDHSHNSDARELN